MKIYFIIFIKNQALQETGLIVTKFVKIVIEMHQIKDGAPNNIELKYPECKDGVIKIAKEKINLNANKTVKAILVR